jgi:hypothetical protein
MTKIIGKLNSSLSGIIRATPTHTFVDTSTTPDTLVSLPYEAAINAGEFTITVPQSQNLGGTGITTESIAYKWELFKNDTAVTFFFLSGEKYEGPTHQHSDTFYYTGSTHADNSIKLDRVSTTNLVLLQPAIYAIAPDSSVDIDFTTLVGIPNTPPYQNISLHRIADLITTVAAYRDRISSKFSPKGLYDANTFYAFGDVVRFNGNGYVWRNAASLKGQAPPMTGDNTNWMMISEKGTTGGTGAQIVGFSPTAWANSAEAAAREDVRAAIASVQPQDLSNYLTKAEGAPRANPTFTGNVKRGQLTYPVPTADKPTEIITAKYVEDAFAALATSSAKLPTPLIYARRNAQLAIGTSSYTVIPWDSIVTNTGNILNSVGDINISENGDYLMHCNLFMEVAGNIGANNTRTIFDIVLSKYANSAFTDIANLVYDNESSSAGAWRSRRQGWRYLDDAVAGEVYNIRARIGGGGVDATGNTIAPGGNGGQANYFVIWKVA